MGKLLSMLTGSLSGNIGDAVKQIASIWKVDPAVVLANETAVAKLANDLAIKTLDSTTAQIQAVNETMRAEAQSTHFLQWAWRPLFGVTGAAIMFNNFILLPYLQGFGIQPIVVPDKVWEVILAVVGVSAFTRGAEKVVTAFQNGKKAN